MISIKTSTSFKNKELSNYLSLDNIDINEYILNTGTFFLKFKLKEKNSNLKDYTFDIASIIEHYETKIQKLKEENEKIKLSKKVEYFEENSLTVSKKENQEEMILINHIDKKYNDMYSKLNVTTDHYDRTLIKNLDPIIKRIHDMNQNFYKFFDKFDKGNVEKGNFGEKFIEDYLTDKFSNCSIEDTHKSTSAGDLLFKFDNLSLLVESKNVSSIRKDDVSKFYKDIQIRTENNEINSALFVSLNNCNLPNNSKFFSFEIKNKIPIIFISDVFNNTELIRMSVIMLNYLSKFIENYSDNISVQNILNDLENSIYLINKQFEYIENDKKLITKFQQNIVNKENDLNKLLKIIIDSIKNNKIKTNDKYTDHNLEQIVNLVKIELKDNSNFKLSMKNIQKFNISSYTIKKYGGIKKINQMIENEMKKESYILLE